MKKFIAIYRGAEGCKTSIGCGMTTTELEANSMEEAKNKVLENILTEQGYGNKIKSGDDKIEEVFTFIDIFEVVNSHPVDLREFYSMVVKGAQEVRKKQKAQDEAEKAQYEKLKHKFEPTLPKNPNEKNEANKEAKKEEKKD